MSGKRSYYAVADGREPGIYNSWEECKAQTNHYSRPVFKKFDSASAAADFMSQNGASSSSYSSRPSNSSYSSRNSGFTVDNEGYTNVYTDGACSSNGRQNARAGYGVYFGPENPLNAYGNVDGRATNNRAEIRAATEAARRAADQGISKLKINTDSKFLMNCSEKWMGKWKENGWVTSDGREVINKEELKEMDRAFKPLDVALNYVPGHKGIHGNEMADKLARKGSEGYRRY